MPSRPNKSGVGRFDLIPPGAERRLAQLFERDAASYGKRDWEDGSRKLSDFVNDAMDAINCLNARDASEDWAARAVWALFGYMHVEARVRAGTLPPEVADMPPPDPILVAGVVSVQPQLPASVDSDVPVPPPGLLPGKTGK